MCIIVCMMYHISLYVYHILYIMCIIDTTFMLISFNINSIIRCCHNHGARSASPVSADGCRATCCKNHRRASRAGMYKNT